MTPDRPETGRPPSGLRPDRLSLCLAVPGLAALALPFASVSASRIASPEPRGLAEAFGSGGVLIVAGFFAFLLVMLILRHPLWRVILSGLVATLVLWATGAAASGLAADVAPYGRVSPASGAWIMLAIAAVLFADGMTRLDPPPLVKLATGIAATGILALLVAGGVLDDLSVVVEFHNRAGSFWQEARAHVVLALGSFGAACLLGLPLGLLASRNSTARGPLTGILTGLQTVPSIAMFGLMIVPLGWLAAHVPGASAIGISGIGTAPAFLALVLYALLPIVSNTEAGLRSVPPATAEAATAMGLTAAQRLWQVDLPLALPILLTGARIVLVQNIGLATVGALIGAGGFGTFVFQGLGQAAVDLILLGTVPTVLLAFLTALVFDTLIALTRKDSR